MHGALQQARKSSLGHLIPAPDPNCEDQSDDDWDVASLPQLSFKPLPSVDVSTQVKWTDLANLELSRS